MSFQRVFSGAKWEEHVGYCRALRAGDRIFVTGTAPVDPDIAAYPSRYSVRRWNYRRTSRYGSENYRLNGEEGLEHVEVRAARVSADRRTVLLEIEDLRPVDQMQVDLDIRGADGATVATSISFTVNTVERERGPEVLADPAPGG